MDVEVYMYDKRYESNSTQRSNYYQLGRNNCCRKSTQIEIAKKIEVKIDRVSSKKTTNTLFLIINPKPKCGSEN